MKKPKLIPHWRKSWRMLSVQFMTLAAALQGAWATIPTNLLASVPPWAVNAVTIGLLVAGILGRLVDQSEVSSQKSA
jgi:hypothetical protein